jgi:heterodisulfide reductase subunit B
MRFALFLGCKIPYFLSHYGDATRLVLRELGVDLVEMEFGCCGYPVRNQDTKAFVLTAARNLALAEKQGLDIFTPCQCCFGSLKKAAFLLREDASLRKEIAFRLAEEGLSYQGQMDIKHLLQVLHQDVGIAAIKQKIVMPFQDLNIAAHYGCHALRPSKVVAFDDPLAPTLFDQLVEATGATSLDWNLKLSCCGNPLWGKNDKLAADMMINKINDGRKAGAAFLCVGCTYCQIQFDSVQKEVLAARPDTQALPSVLYVQLLGLAMGLSPEALGLPANLLDASGLSSHLAQIKHGEPEALPETQSAS